MKQKRLRPAARKQMILAAVLPVAVEGSYSTITRDRAARAAGVSGPVIQYHFGSMAQFRIALMIYAVEQRCARVVAQGLVLGDVNARMADDELRASALTELA